MWAHLGRGVTQRRKAQRAKHLCQHWQENTLYYDNLLSNIPNNISLSIESRPNIILMRHVSLTLRLSCLG